MFTVKNEIRIIGWDDKSLGNKKFIKVVGIITRGGIRMDGMLLTKVKRDGLDSTEKISKAIIKSRHYDQLRAIMLDGITFAGFNIADINRMNEITKLPVIVIQKKKPNMKKFISAIKNLNNYKERLKMVKNAGKFYRAKNIYFQVSGIEKETAKRIIDISSIYSSVPEPLRLAHIIASGLSGESRGGI